MQTQSMEALLSQLAETAAQERALLEECGDLLSVAASLEVNANYYNRSLTSLGFDPAVLKSWWLC